MEDGLVRTNNSYQPNNSRYTYQVFPQFYVKSDSYAMGHYTKLLKQLSPDTMKGFISVKSLRCGSHTELLNDRNLKPEEKQARGGWADKSNGEFYVRCIRTLLSPGMMKLSGYDNVLQQAIIPDDEGIQSMDHYHNIKMMMSTLFNNSIDLFKKDGKLRVFYDVCAYSAIKWYPYWSYKYGNGHPFVRRMIERAQTAGIYPTNTPEAHSVLLTFGTAISKKFEERKVNSYYAEKETVVETFSSGMAATNLKLSLLNSRVEELTKECKDLTNIVKILTEKLSESTSQMVNSPCNMVSAYAVTNSPAADSVVQFSSNGPDATDAPQVARSNNAFSLLMHNAPSKTAPVDSNKEFVSTVFRHMYKSNKFSNWRNGIGFDTLKHLDRKVPHLSRRFSVSPQER